MQSPEQENEKDPLPASVSIVEVPNGSPSPPDSVSRLSEPSTGMVAALSSPIGAIDLGLPRTPESRVIKPVDEAAIDEGYDSEGLRAPWERQRYWTSMARSWMRHLFRSDYHHYHQWWVLPKMSRKKV